MTGIVACSLPIPWLAEAAQARGIRLVPLEPDRPHPCARAAVIGCDGDPAERLAPVRAWGWGALLMLVLAEGGCVTRALDAGADDAVVHPVNAEEIAARIAARLRTRPARRIRVGALTIDTVERRVARDGQHIPLLPREYALLVHLVRHAGTCISRAELLRKVWGLRFDPGTNVVEVHVSRLRAKLDRGFDDPMIETERRIGYRLRAAARFR